MIQLSKYNVDENKSTINDKDLNGYRLIILILEFVKYLRGYHKELIKCKKSYIFIILMIYIVILNIGHVLQDFLKAKQKKEEQIMNLIGLRILGIMSIEWILLQKLLWEKPT